MQEFLFGRSGMLGWLGLVSGRQRRITFERMVRQMWELNPES